MKRSLCERCVLPDCDSASKQCLLRQAWNRCTSLRKRGRSSEVSDTDRDAANEFYEIWRREREALVSEGTVQPSRNMKSQHPESQNA